MQKEELNPAVRPVVKDLKKEKKSYKVDVLITLWPKLSKLPKLNQTVEVESITPTEEEISDQIDHLLPIGWAHGERYSDDQWIGIEKFC